jgi:hypothetical protein
MVIDPDTFTRYEDAALTAQRTGLALPEVLDGRGLLVTAKRRADLEKRVLDDLQRRLERQAPNKLLSWHLNRTTGTAAEMFAAVVEWVDAYCRANAQGKLEDL